MPSPNEHKECQHDQHKLILAWSALSKLTYWLIKSMNHSLNHSPLNI